MFKLAGGANILFISPLGSKSHLNVFRAVSFELAKHGHKITQVASFAGKAPPGVTDIVIPGTAKLIEEAGNTLWTQEGSAGGMLGVMRELVRSAEQACRMTLNDPAFKKVTSGSEKFDLIFGTY